MIDTNHRLLLKRRLSGVGVAVVHRVVVLLLLTHSCGVQCEVTGSSQPVVAMESSSTVLPCHLDGPVSAGQLTVEWARPDLQPRLVHLHRAGVDLLTEQHPSYKGRTSLSIPSLERGDLSLRLSRVHVSDAGTYGCFVPDGQRSEVELIVGRTGSLSITTSVDQNTVMVGCETSGWSPEPEVLVLDAGGSLVSGGTTVSVRGPDLLYSVSYKVSLEVKQSTNFTCRVQQRIINQSREFTVNIPGTEWFTSVFESFSQAEVQSVLRVVSDEYLGHLPSSEVPRTIGVIVAVVICVVAVIGLVVWKIKLRTHQDEAELDTAKNETFSHSPELQVMVEGRTGDV